MRRSSYVFTTALLAVILCGSISYAQVTTDQCIPQTVPTRSQALVPIGPVPIYIKEMSAK
jgi:hypothetical protein